ncbi:hypothetical protein VTI74DRAFT_2319 [Chaetomium olivicolor]
MALSNSSQNVGQAEGAEKRPVGGSVHCKRPTPRQDADGLGPGVRTTTGIRRQCSFALGDRTCVQAAVACDCSAVCFSSILRHSSGPIPIDSRAGQDNA